MIDFETLLLNGDLLYNLQILNKAFLYTIQYFCYQGQAIQFTLQMGQSKTWIGVKYEI